MMNHLVYKKIDNGNWYSHVTPDEFVIIIKYLVEIDCPFEVSFPPPYISQELYLQKDLNFPIELNFKQFS